MEFKSGHFYTHRNMLDCVIYVYQAEKVKEGQRVHIHWLTKSGLTLAAKGTEIIKKKEYPNWVEYDWKGVYI